MPQNESALCPSHGTPLVSFCPRCRGQAGGKRTSPRKTAAVRLNARRPRTRKAAGSITEPEKRQVR
jgi:hypothetical protein